jgi:hypothetical protein
MEAQRCAIARLGFANTPEITEYVAKTEMSERMLRFEVQRRADARLGFVKAPEAVEHTPEFGMRVGKVGLQAQNASRKLTSASSSLSRFRSALPRLFQICGMSTLSVSA